MDLRLSEVYFFALLTWLAVTQGGAIKSPLYWSPLSEAYLVKPGACRVLRTSQAFVLLFPHHRPPGYPLKVSTSSRAMATKVSINKDQRQR